MEIAFDSGKDAVNLAKHGVSLAFGRRVFDDVDHILIGSFRPIDGEERFKAVGLVNGRLFTAVHVKRDRVVRFISVRRSNVGEERAYRTSSGSE